jgi:LysR family transcriptional activator of nhaA
MFNFNHLFYFFTTVKSGSTTLAAKRLRISQPSLSSQLKVLDGSLNVKLFVKVGRHNELTEVGRLVYAQCKKMFDISEELKTQIDETTSITKRGFNLGVSSEIEYRFYAEMLQQFLIKQSHMAGGKINLVTGTPDELVQQLKFFTLDAIITHTAVVDSELMNVASQKTPVVLLSNQEDLAYIDDKLSKKEQNLLARFDIHNIDQHHSKDWIMPNFPSKLRMEIDEFFEANELKVKVSFESQMVSALISGIESHIGIALLPKAFAQQNILEGTVHIIGPKEGFWTYNVWLTCHKQNATNPLLKSLTQSFNLNPSAFNQYPKTKA